MKIYKTPERLLFDTENPNKIEFLPVVATTAQPLLMAIEKIEKNTNEYDFIKRRFQIDNTVEHPILSNYRTSNYYCINF